MGELQRAVVAAEGGDGAVVFQYGWVESIDTEMERHRAEDLYDRRGDWLAPEWTTTLRWAQPPSFSATYPSAAQFAEQLPAGCRTLTASAAEG